MPVSAPAPPAPAMASIETLAGASTEAPDKAPVAVHVNAQQAQPQVSASAALIQIPAPPAASEETEISDESYRQSSRRSRRSRLSRVSFDETNIEATRFVTSTWRYKLLRAGHRSDSASSPWFLWLGAARDISQMSPSDTSADASADASTNASARTTCMITLAIISTLAFMAEGLVVLGSASQQLSDESAISMALAASVGPGAFMLCIAAVYLQGEPEARPGRSFLERDRQSRDHLTIIAPGLVFLVLGIVLMITRAPEPFGPSRIEACTRMDDFSTDSSVGSASSVGRAANSLASTPAPIVSHLLPAATFERALQTAQSLGWTVVWSSPAELRFNAAVTVGVLPFDGILNVSLTVLPVLPTKRSIAEASRAVGSTTRSPQSISDRAYIHSAIAMCSASPGRTRDFGLNAATIHKFEQRFGPMMRTEDTAAG